MAQTKICNQCNKSKSTLEFYKMSASKDGLQPKCKECCKVVNKNFREVKPEYQIQWQRTNKKKWLSYVTDWAKKNVRADDSRSAVYYIINPENKIYVGSTQTPFSARKSAHKIQHKYRTASLPALHYSFDLYGFENHKWKVIDLAGMDKETLTMVEYTMINHFSKLGLSLNVRLK
jgi:hypothetical protein